MSFERNHLYINGEFVAARGSALEIDEAATGELLGVTGIATAAHVDAAVAAARAAQPAWAAKSPEERAEVLDRFAAALAARSEQTAALASRENGMPISLSERVNGLTPPAIVGYYAALARSFAFEEIRDSLIGHTIVRRRPLGVVAALSPWNYPQALAIMKIAPALATGNAVVFKAAPETALDAFVFADAAHEAGLPAGLLNVLPGGREPSEHLVSHPGVDKVAFTGSTRVGREIATVCAGLLRPVTLELGGKSAAIVLDDVDIETLTAGIYGSSFVNNGQTCYASTRILAPASRYDEVVDTITALAERLVVGDPLDPATQLGPVVTSRQRDSVLSYIDAGKASDARLTTGGHAIDREGWFVAPTIFADVDNGDTIAQEEIFGPVLTITRYENDEHAVALANDSRYGLGGTVWSQDEERATAIARRVDTGTIGVNQYTLDLGSPFGGTKESGLGRELGPEALNNFVDYQSIYRVGARG